MEESVFEISFIMNYTCSKCGSTDCHKWWISGDVVLCDECIEESRVNVIVQRPHHHHIQKVNAETGVVVRTSMFVCTCGNIDQPDTRPKET